MSEEVYYVGLDVHKKMVAYCVKLADGTVVTRGSVVATRLHLQEWVEGLPKPWMGALEATIFTGWIYDFLKPHAVTLKVGHPSMLKALIAGKKKSDKIDAGKLADLLRCNLLPECYMAPTRIRDLRRMLRYRNMLVRQAVQHKNRIATLLMEMGIEYEKKQLHRKKYYNELIGRLEDVPEEVYKLLTLSRATWLLFHKVQRQLIDALESHPEIKERVERLQTILGVGEVTALTWVLEIGDPKRFGSVRKAQSYCGLCSGQHESAGKAQRGPISKQRNAHLQTKLIEAAKLAPRHNPALKALHQKERARGANKNQATLALARKLVAYLLAVDKSGKDWSDRQAA